MKQLRKTPTMTIRFSISSALLGALVLTTACGGSSTPAADTMPDTTDTVVVPDEAPVAEPMSVQIETHASQGEKRVVEGAAATLASSDAGIELTYNSPGLSAGHVYTVWVVAINNPSACATAPCTPKDVLSNHEGVEADVAFGAGAVADDSGSVSMTATMPAGAWSNSWFTGGLTKPTTAEVHMVLNDHGPVIEGRKEAMLSSYREGCTDESLPPPFPDTAKSDGAAGPNKCALMQDAIFVQAK